MIVCVAADSVVVENAACPLGLSAVGPASVAVGLVHVPSMNVTEPVVTNGTPAFTVAVKVTLSPKVDGLSDEVSAVVVVARTTWTTLPLLAAKPAAPP